MLMNACGPKQHRVPRQPDVSGQPRQSRRSRSSSTRRTWTTARPTTTWPSGKAQWGSQFHPQHQDLLNLNKSKDNHTWSPPLLNVGLFPKPGPVAQGHFDPRCPAGDRLRDRPANQVALIGEGGQPAGRQPEAAIVTPTFEKYFDQAGLAAAGLRQAERRQSQAVAVGRPATRPATRLKLSVISITGLHRLGRLARGHQAGARPRSASS